jgi:hypothetical protein
MRPFTGQLSRHFTPRSPVLKSSIVIHLQLLRIFLFSFNRSILQHPFYPKEIVIETKKKMEYDPKTRMFPILSQRGAHRSNPALLHPHSAIPHLRSNQLRLRLRSRTVAGHHRTSFRNFDFLSIYND